MNMFLTLAYLFFIGSTLGWVAELLYRRFLSGANPERKWINPGFCVGPYVPLYGSGLCILYLLASIGEKNGVDTVGEKLLLCGELREIEIPNFQMEHAFNAVWNKDSVFADTYRRIVAELIGSEQTES